MHDVHSPLSGTFSVFKSRFMGMLRLVLIWLSVLILSPKCMLAQSGVDQVHITQRTNFMEKSNDARLITRSNPFISNVDLVMVPVTVSDPVNRLVLGLDKDNFQIFDNKELQSIDHFSSEDAPLSLAVVLDSSGSMANHNKIGNARKAVLEFLKTSNPEDELLLISVADKPELRTDFTNSIETIESALLQPSPRGSTALLDGIYLAMNQMKNAKYSRKALLIISDGGDNNSRYNEREIVDLVKESDVLIYSIGIYDEFFQSEEERMGPLLLSDVSELTGGRLFTVNNPNSLADVAAKIGSELRSQYVIGYKLKAPLRDGKWHKVHVKLLATRGIPRVQVNAKKGYYAPSR
jgi:Ca-activated chloride channel homolog